MNLIEQLGGYEETKKHLNSCWCDDENRAYILKKLLEYRHHHNIFEVGDLVVYNQPIGVDRVVSVTDEHLIPRFLWQIRHATDEEIKAGKRLEVTK